jgi:hypothetical protein
MTTEQQLLGALSAMTTALGWVVIRLWGEMQTYKREAIATRSMLSNVREKLGEVKGRLDVYERCHIADCPYKNMPPIQRIVLRPDSNPAQQIHNENEDRN